MELWELMLSKLSTIFGSLSGQAVAMLSAIIVILIFLLLGKLVADISCSILKKIANYVRFESKIRGIFLKESLKGFIVTDILLKFIEAYIILVFLGTGSDLIGLNFFTGVISLIISYFPGLVQGLLVVVLAVLLSNYLKDQIVSLEGIPNAPIFGSLAQMVILYIAAVMALPLVLPSVDITLLQRTLELFLAAIAGGIGFGAALAFGLGMKDAVSIAAKKRQDYFDKLFLASKKRR